MKNGQVTEFSRELAYRPFRAQMPKVPVDGTVASNTPGSVTGPIRLLHPNLLASESRTDWTSI